MSSSTNTLHPPQTAAVPAEPVWRFNVEQYHQMICLGILNDDDPVELLEGWLIYKMPKNPPHRAATKLTHTALVQLAPPGWYVDAQEPITLTDSEPELDVAIVRGSTLDYLDRHPSASDIALIVEVADSTLERDRTIKHRLYARHSIPVYWIINLPEQQIEVYTQPVVTSVISESRYQNRRDYKLDDRVPVAIAGQVIGELSVRDLLPLRLGL
jgi:Uma2 family endonuclease